MANWYGSCRSNYFKVKDLEAFTNMIGLYEANLIGKLGTDLVGFTSDAFNGEIPSRSIAQDGKDEEVTISILDEIANHLLEGQICVVMEIGAEKLRYITGLAFAISWTGERVELSLNDIYKIAAEVFSGADDITECSY